MNSADYAQAFASAGIEIGSVPPPREGWGWRFHYAAWNGPFETEAQALQAVLHTLVLHTQRNLYWERLDHLREQATRAQADLLSPEEQAAYDAAWARFFPPDPYEGWHWHVHDQYPVFVFRHNGRWFAHRVLAKDIAAHQQEQLEPGLYEQLVRLGDRVIETDAGND